MVTRAAGDDLVCRRGLSVHILEARGSLRGVRVEGRDCIAAIDARVVKRLFEKHVYMFKRLNTKNVKGFKQTLNKR